MMSLELNYRVAQSLLEEHKRALIRHMLDNNIKAIRLPTGKHLKLEQKKKLNLKSSVTLAMIEEAIEYEESSIIEANSELIREINEQISQLNSKLIELFNTDKLNELKLKAVKEKQNIIDDLVNYYTVK